MLTLAAPDSRLTRKRRRLAVGCSSPSPFARCAAPSIRRAVRVPSASRPALLLSLLSAVGRLSGEAGSRPPCEAGIRLSRRYCCCCMLLLLLCPPLLLLHSWRKARRVAVPLSRLALSVVAPVALLLLSV